MYIIIKEVNDSVGFLCDGGYWSKEYPDATKFKSIRKAKNLCNLLSDCSVVINYGYDDECVVHRS